MIRTLRGETSGSQLEADAAANIFEVSRREKDRRRRRSGGGLRIELCKPEKRRSGGGIHRSRLTLRTDSLLAVTNAFYL